MGLKYRLSRTKMEMVSQKVLFSQTPPIFYSWELESHILQLKSFERLSSSVSPWDVLLSLRRLLGFKG